jgi:hypothetical protein
MTPTQPMNYCQNIAAAILQRLLRALRWFGKRYLGLIRNFRSIDAPGTGQPLFTFAAQQSETPLWERLDASSRLLLSV